MLLTYSLDRFPDQIKSGEKIHTLRDDPHKRWKPGMSIQHWRGNPRNTRAAVKPYCFLEGECKGVQEVHIQRVESRAASPVGFEVILMGQFLTPVKWLTPDEIELLAKNDGLTIDELREWFVPEDSPVWDGRIIHYTDFKY